MNRILISITFSLRDLNTIYEIQKKITDHYGDVQFILLKEGGNPTMVLKTNPAQQLK